ncbi:CHAT domain-containing protein [Streptomyces sp. NPDC051993]|uniref:CHAT domain-containing protein n=1 Tax=Streptomyces sp. NPDC051993 TaxID=3155286 RepID=UPI0034388A5B
MTISVRAAYTWDCERCGQERHAPVWRIVDARERADVLVAPGPGVSWLDCPVCGTREHIEAPLLVLRPGAVAPMLLAVPVAELQGGAPPSAPPLLEEAERAGAFRGGGFFGQVIPLPRRLLPFALTRDVERDLADPEEACRQLQPEGAPTVANYRIFLEYLAEDADHAAVRSLLRLVTTTAPDQLAQLLVAYPQLTGDTRVRDAGREELRAAEGAPLEAVLRMRQRLLDELCDGRTPREAAIRNYFESLNSFGAGLRERLYAMYREARTVSGPAGIPLVRDALTLAAQIGEERIETELAARLGRLLVDAVRAGLDADLSEALRVLELALGRLPECSLQWAEVAGNLAAAHHERDDGDRMEIWATACDLLSRAAALDRREHPEIWARIQTNYGLLLAERPGGGPEDLVLGIARIKAGLEERSPERDRVNWAYSMLNLGLLLQCLHRGAGSDYRSQAEECYRQALGHLDADDDPALWSQLQCNLADVLLARDPADVRGAIRAATSVLDLRAARSYTFDTARPTWVLARATARLEGPESVASRRLYRAALAAAPPEVSPSLHISMARELLHTHASAERWIEAADVATDMLTAVNALFDAQVTAAGRRSVLVQLDRLARWAAYLLARAGRPERAVEAIERGLACELSVVAGRGAVDLAELERIDPATARRYRRAHARYRTSVAQPPSAMSDGPAPVTDQQAAVERELRSVVEEIRAIPGFERFLRTAEIADIFRACGGMPLAYLVTAPWGGYVLTLPGTSAASGGGGAEDAMPPVLAVPVPEVSSVTVLGLLVMETGDGEGEPGRAGLLLVQAAGALRRRRELPVVMRRLSVLEPLLRPVATLLTGSPGRAAVVIPTGLLGMVPLHAVPTGSASDQVVDDIGTLTVVPSAAAYAASRSRAGRPSETVPRLVAITDPDGSLPGSRSELAEIQTLFGRSGESSCAVGPDATVEWLLDHLAEASHLHLSCHGSADIGRGGSLALADGRLDMDTLVRHQLPVCRMAVASACQSGHYAVVSNPDQFLGLPAGFLQAGAACVVTSLWPVNDAVTALLMTRLYEVLDHTHDPVAALRQTRRWLRRLTGEDLARYTAAHRHLAALTERYALQSAPTDERPFSSPVHWGAFTVWGA